MQGKKGLDTTASPGPCEGFMSNKMDDNTNRQAMDYDAFYDPTTTAALHPHNQPPQELHVNAEEVAIFLFVLLLWAGAISLFYHQWGKIRGLDDYQPDYVHANMTIHRDPLPEESNEQLKPTAASVVSPSSCGVDSNDHLLGSSSSSRGPRGVLNSDLTAGRNLQAVRCCTTSLLHPITRSHLVPAYSTSKSMDEQATTPLSIEISCDQAESNAAADGLASDFSLLTGAPAPVKITSFAQSVLALHKLNLEARYSGEFYKTSGQSLGGLSRETRRLDDCQSTHSGSIDPGLPLYLQNSREMAGSNPHLHIMGGASGLMRKTRQGQSTTTLHKVGNSTAANIHMTRHFVSAANKRLAASTLRLWQADTTSSSSSSSAAIPNRKTKSVINLQECL